MNNIVNHDDRPIGVFDSGIGGLTVLKAIQKSLPSENLIYLGDLARIPYGTKSTETIRHYTKEAVTFLLNQNVKMIVIACNTVATNAGDIVESMCDNAKVISINLVDVMLRQLIETNINNLSPILILGTPQTIASGYYQKQIKRLYAEKSMNNHDVQNELIVYAQGCELFVPFIETGKLNFTNDIQKNTNIDFALDHIIIQYFKDLEHNHPNAHKEIKNIILACTHYPMIKDKISYAITQYYHDFKVTPNGWIYLDPADATAEYIKSLLRLNKNCEIIDHCITQYYVTDMRERFMCLASIFLGHNIDNVNIVTL